MQTTEVRNAVSGFFLPARSIGLFRLCRSGPSVRAPVFAAGARARAAVPFRLRGWRMGGGRRGAGLVRRFLLWVMMGAAAVALAGTVRAQDETFRFVSGTISGTELKLVFSEQLRTTPKPAAALFNVWSSTTYLELGVSAVGVSGKALTLTLASAPPAGEGVLVYHCHERTSCPSAPVTSASGGTIAGNTEFKPITQPPVGFTHAVVRGYGIVLHFDGNLNASQVPAAAAFTVSGFSTSLQGLALTSTEAHKVELFVSPPVPNGTRPDVAYAVPDENPLTSADSSRGDVAAFQISDSTANEYEDPGPVVRSISGSGDELRLTFDAALTAPSGLSASDFSVCTAYRNGETSGCTAASSFTVSGANVALGFAAGTLAAGATLWLYHAPGRNAERLYATADSSRKAAQIERHPFRLAAATAPRYSAITGDGASISISFSSALDAANAPSSSAFTVSGRSVTAAAITGGAVALTVSPALADGEAATLGYDAAAGNLAGTNGLAVASWTGASISNRTDAAPVLRSARSNAAGDAITLAFSEPLDAGAATGIPAISAFSLTSGSSAVTSAAVTGSEVALAVSPALAEGASAALAYAPPTDATAAKLRDADQGKLPVAAFSVTVDNRTDTAPVLDSAAVDGSALTLTFDQALSASHVPAGSAFTVTVAGSSRGVSGVSLSGSAATLTLASAVAHGEAVTVAYTAPSANGLRDGSGNAVASFAATAVANNTPAPLPALDAATVDGTAVSLTFDGNLEANASLDKSAFTFTPSRTVSAASASGSAVSITIGETIAEGASLSVSYSPPSTASAGIRAADGRALAGFSQSLTNDTDTAPVLSSAAVNGAALTLTFDQALKASSVPAASAFSVTVAGSARSVSAVRLSGSTAALTLASAVAHGEAVTVSYTPPGLSPLVDGTGNAVAAFGPVAAANNTPKPLPTVSSATVDGTTVRLGFSGNLTAGSSVPASAFTFTPANTASSISASGAALTMTLGTAVAEGAALSVAYAPPTAANMRLLAADGREIAAFSTTLVNETDTAPVLTGATVDGAALTLAFDQTLGHAAEPAASAFTVTVAGTAATVSAVASSSSNVVLTLASAALPGQAVTVAYAKPAANPLADATGNPVASFAAVSATNATLPTATSASVDGDAVTISFSGALKADSALTAARFVLFPAYAASSAAASGSTVTLALSAAVPEDVAFTLEYDTSIAAAQPLRAAGGTALKGFQINLANRTDTAPAILSLSAAGDAITLTFDQALDLAALPAASQFTVAGTDAVIQRVLIANAGTGGRGVITLPVRPDVREVEALTLSYAKAAAGANIRDPEGNELAAFSTQAVTNLTDTAPAIASAAVTGDAVAIAFDQDLEAVAAVSASHFTLTGTSAAVSSGSVANGDDGLGLLSLALDRPVHELDEVAITYSPPTPSSAKDVRDPEGRRAVFASFSLRNLTDTAPVAASATGNLASISLAFDQPISLSGAVAAAFSLDGTSAAVSTATAAGATVTIALDSPLKEGEAVKLGFAPGATAKILDGTGNAAAAFSISVDNETDTAPVPDGGIVGDGGMITVTFDQPLAERTLTSAGFSLSPRVKLRERATIAGKTLTLRTDVDLREGVDYKLKYVKPDAPLLEDLTGNAVASFTADVDNRTDVGPTFVGGTVIGRAVTLRFDQEIALRGTPELWLNREPPQLNTEPPESIGCNGLTLLGPGDRRLPVDLDSAAASGRELTLALQDAVAAEDDVRVCHRPVGGNGGNGVTDVQPAPADGQASDPVNPLGEIEPDPAPEPGSTIKPKNWLRNLTVAARVDGRVLTIVFAEPLRAAADLERGITLTAGGAGVGIASMALVAGTLLRGTLARPIEEDEGVRVAYSAAAGALRYDADELAVPDFDLPAANLTDTPSAPLAAILNGTRLEIEFSRELDPARPPSAASFTMRGAPPVQTVVSASGRRLVLELRAPAGGPRRGIAVSYRPSAADRFPDAGGTPVPAFADFPVRDIGPEPRPVSAVGDGNWLAVRFDRPLDPDRKPPRTAWFALAASNLQIERVVRVSRFEVELRLAGRGLRDREDAAVVYVSNLPYRVKLRGAGGDQVRTFILPLLNATETDPSIEHASARHRSIRLRFDQMMRPEAAPADFEATVDGLPAPLAALRWSDHGRALHLQLRDTPAPGTEIRLRYAGQAKLHDLSGKPLTSLDITLRNTAP